MAIPALEALARLREALDGEVVEVPEDGYLTLKQWGAEWSMSDVHAGRLILPGVELGTWEMKRFRIRAGGVLRHTKHFREKPIRDSRKAKK